MKDPDLEARLEYLSAEVARLGARVARLEAAKGQPDDSAPVPGTARVEAADAASPEGGAAWGAASTVLSRTAVVCFLLVVALVLRTLTDGGLLAPGPGAGVGVAYAVALLAAGGALQPRRAALAPLVAVCGVLLLCAVVVEGHRRLGVFPEAVAHGLLAGAGCVLGLLGRRGVAAAACAGVPALLAAGVALGLSFPGLSAVLLGASVAALGVGRRPRCGWLPWLVVAATAALWAGWAVRAGEPALGGDGVPGGRAGSWYLPVLALFVALHLAAAFRGLWASSPGRPGVLDGLVPATTVGWAFPALAAVAPGTLWPAAVGALGAGGLLVVAGAGARQGLPGKARVAAFANAAGLLSLAVTASLPPSPLAAPVLAAGALGLTLVAERWQSGGARAGSYALQGAAAAWAAAAGGFAAGRGSAAVAAAAAGGAAVLAFLHYRRCRSRPVPEASWFFGRLDRTDDTAAVALLASLVLAFLAARAAVYPAVAAWAQDVAGAFQGAQSVIVHLSAVALGLGALVRRDRELRMVALLVIAVGALKTLLYDLLTLHGLPLVASVLLFGGAAAALAVLLRRWPVGDPVPAESTLDRKEEVR